MSAAWQHALSSSTRSTGVLPAASAALLLRNCHCSFSDVELGALSTTSWPTLVKWAVYTSSGIHATR
eukprot:6038741-Prymnesium_polylepis.1